jgi:hypothetical protein
MHGVIRCPELWTRKRSSRPKQSLTVVSSKKTLTVLQRGVEIVRQAIEADTRVGVGYARVQRLAELSRRITWAYVVGNGVYAADGTAATNEVQVAILQGPPPARLNQDATFQAHEGDDGFPRIYVQPRRYTATWAGIVLFHELDHVLDRLDGAASLSGAGEDWWNAEARAYHHVALIIDAVSGGRFLPALAGLAAVRSVSDLVDCDPEHLSEDLYRQAFGGRVPEPPRSAPEGWARSASLVFGAVVATHAHPVSLADLTESSAGPELRRAAETWGWSSGKG